MDDKFIQLMEDTVAKVLKQGVKSQTDYTYKGGTVELVCSYRGYNGNKCFVGHMISDDKYDVEIEGKTVYDDRVKKAIIRSHPDITFNTEMFGWIALMQGVHDSEPVEEWEQHFNHYLEKMKACPNFYS